MPGNDILFRYQPSGASATTAAQSERLKKKHIVGVKASQALAEEDLGKLRQYGMMFVALGKKYDIPPALLAAIASRESRAGALLDNGWGDHHNGYGLMQVDRRSHSLKGGPYSLEHLNQATGILQESIHAVTQKHPDWAAEQKLRGGVAAYNFGAGNVKSIAGMDSGTTGNDYSSDVWARAQFLAPYIGGGGQGTAAPSAPAQAPSTASTHTPSAPPAKTPAKAPAAKATAAASRPPAHAGSGKPLAVVHDLQLWLIRHHYMTEAEMRTGPGIPGPRTHEAVARFLAGHGQTPHEPSTAKPSTKPSPTPKAAPPLKAVPAPKTVPTPKAVPVPPTPSAPSASDGASVGSSQTTRKVKVPFYSQYEAGHGYDPGGVSCLLACCAMAKAAGVRVQEVKHHIQVGLSEDRKGHLKVDAQQALAGRRYIDGQLDAGRPVVVGVSHEDGSSTRNEGLTDHFVIITTRGTDKAGRTYYAFHDPATGHANLGSDTNAHNRFYVDKTTGNLQKSGLEAEGYVVERHFEVAMVRLNH